MSSLKWIAGGIVLIGLGLTLWYTAFLAVPAGLVLIGVGLVKALKRRTG